jgi:carbon-monoxide dehydrogenase medium subunit
MWQNYIIPSSLNEALDQLANGAGSTRIVAGGTDILLEMERGVRKGVSTLVDITRLPGLDEIWQDESDIIHFGPNVTHNQIVSSALMREKALPLYQAAWQVGSPQIRNRGTVVGNLVTASPANDTITPLVALDASIHLQSRSGKRAVELGKFYTGVRKTVMRPDEMVVDVTFKPIPTTAKAIFIKYALRRAQAISLLNLAIILNIQDGTITHAAITLGAVAPTIVHARKAEAFLVGKPLNLSLLENQVANLVEEEISPISDIRGSAEYRDHVVKVMVNRGFASLLDGTTELELPAKPVLLWGNNQQISPMTESVAVDRKSPITTTINGETRTFTTGQQKTLLRFLREEAGMVGVKEGCAEGECGACTIFLDGKAVMACLVPAPRAHGAEIVTVEGLSKDDALHPVQQAFLDEGAVQCGYCTPGFIMSAVKLLEEVPHPDTNQIKESITGNLCRCTGYYKIITAIEKASEKR